MASKCRHWIWVLNNYTAEHVTLASSLVERGIAEYVAFQPERGGLAGTPHLQGVVSFKHPCGVKGCADRLPGRPHVEPMRACIDQAVAYAHKVFRPLLIENLALLHLGLTLSPNLP